MKARKFRMMRLRLWVPFVAVIGSAWSCTESTALKDIDVGLPARTSDVDTTGVTAGVRMYGGNVFVALTGEPTAMALEVLERAGLGPPIPADSPASIVTFPNLQIKTVAGYLSAGRLRAIAELRFVTRVEASGGAMIHPAGAPRE